MIRVVLVDDHVVVRSGFAQLLGLEEDLSVSGQYSTAAEAWPALLKNDVDVAVLDVAMPDENGLSLLKRLRVQRPDFRAIILSIYDTPAFVQSALDAGASGYLTKRCGPEELVSESSITCKSTPTVCSNWPKRREFLPDAAAPYPGYRRHRSPGKRQRYRGIPGCGRALSGTPTALAIAPVSVSATGGVLTAFTCRNFCRSPTPIFRV